MESDHPQLYAMVPLDLLIAEITTINIYIYIFVHVLDRLAIYMAGEYYNTIKLYS